MSSWSWRTPKGKLEGLENVENWKPSSRPKYQNLRTRDIVTLDKVGDTHVWLRKSCGRSFVVTKTEFLKSWKRV